MEQQSGSKSGKKYVKAVYGIKIAGRNINNLRYADDTTFMAESEEEIKRCLLLRRNVMTNLDSILKSRDITLPAKVRLVKAMVFPVVMLTEHSVP